MRGRGVYGTIIGTDILPTSLNSITTLVAGVPHIGTIPLSQLADKWHDHNNAAYNQLLLCISPEFQTAIDETDIATEAWEFLTIKFKPHDPSKISIVWTKYENYHMVKGQSVTSYLTTMKEFRNQLGKMGEMIANSTHATTILRNVPESWRPIAQTIQMITRDPEMIEERLEAHEADLNALEILNQATTAFTVLSKPQHQTSANSLFQHPYNT